MSEESIGITNYKKDTLEGIFRSNCTYCIPFFQREFSWDKERWEDFFEDLEESMKTGKGHFFGFMTFKKPEKNEIEIIEGQQRITITTTLICVIRDMLLELNDEKWKEFDLTYIKNQDILSENNSAYNFKLSLSDINRLFFIDYIQKEGIPSIKIQKMKSEVKINISNRLIRECYIYLHQMLIGNMQNLSTGSLKKDYLTRVVKTLLRDFVIINTEVTDSISAYNIFQTLNDRGLNLTLADLLKTNLLKIVDKDWKEAKERWDEIRSILENVDINSFLRHYWLSSKEVIKEGDLLDKIEKNIRTKEDVFNFLASLKTEAEVYTALLNPTKDFWEDKETIDLLNELKILIKQQAMPLLMAGYTLEASEFKSLIKIMINFIFRYLTIAEAENKVVERLFSDIAIKIREGDIKEAKETKKYLSRYHITDELFLSLLIEKDIRQNRIAKYILEKIENFIDIDKEKISEKITLEHILPKTPNEEWLSYMKENKIDDLDEVVNKLGNMTLLMGRVNKKAQNNFFIKKRDEFYSKMTKLKINEPLKSMVSWNKEDIKNRQKILAELAVKIWQV
ncbi:Uncharacterised protein [uncultured archaeon]|nr:Uncharacterised protein [uncultured archaeon]